MKRTWYEIQNVGNGSVEVLLYDEIGMGGIAASDFVRDLQGVKAKAITLRINSPGGDAFDGIAIYNAIKRHPAEVHAVVDGLAASTASFIAQAGTTVLMAEGSSMMIHEPHGLTMGDAQDHAKMAETLDKMGDNIASLYAGRAGGDEALWRSRMKVESWYRAQEAIDVGLADGLVSGKAENRMGVFNLSHFKNVPPWARVWDAEWDTAWINNLPDSAFAVVLAGGEKDEDGKTVPRNLRKLPHHGSTGAVDEPHLRNALAREPQTDMPEADHAKAKAHLRAHMNAEDHGDIEILNPYPNEHACRLRDPGDFQPNSFRRMSRDHDGKRYDVIIGRLKGESATTEQAYRYPKTVWTADAAHSHCEDHDGRFEAATEGDQAEALDALTQTLIPPLGSVAGYQAPVPSLKRLLSEHPLKVGG
jgi:ATP-dependent protease ClpP protease subunit